MSVYEVTNIKKVDSRKYKTGDFFITGEKVYMLIKGKMRPVQFSAPSLSGYVKKKEIDDLIQKEVEKQLKGETTK